MTNFSPLPPDVQAAALLPYQIDWLADQSRQKAVCKARRIGFTYVASLECALRLCGIDLGSDKPVRPAPQCIISAGSAQAVEFLRRVKVHIEAWEKAFGRTFITANSATLLTVRALNDATVQARAFSTNPATIRSFEGDVTLDEFAHIPRLEKVYAAAKSLANRTINNPQGYRIRAVFTPFGDDNLAYEIARGKHSPGERERRNLKPRWSVHNVSIFDAIAQGFPENVNELREDAGTEEMFEQEYNLGFLSSSDRYIDSEMLDRCLYHDAAEKPPTPVSPAMLYLGMDVARHRHNSAVVITELIGDVLWQLGTTQYARDMDWDSQEAWFAEIMDPRGGHPIRRAHLDGTSIGDQFGERLRKRFGEHRVVPVNFGSAGVKEDLASGLKLLIERARYRLNADDVQLRTDILSMRRTYTAAGNAVYKVPETKAGHGDGAWAAALSAQASGAVQGGIKDPRIKTATMDTGDGKRIDRRPKLFSGPRRRVI